VKKLLIIPSVAGYANLIRWGDYTVVESDANVLWVVEECQNEWQESLDAVARNPEQKKLSSRDYCKIIAAIDAARGKDRLFFHDNSVLSRREKIKFCIEEAEGKSCEIPDGIGRFAICNLAKNPSFQNVEVAYYRKNLNG
jgi:hypothetical protein